MFPITVEPPRKTNCQRETLLKVWINWKSASERMCQIQSKANCFAWLHLHRDQRRGDPLLQLITCSLSSFTCAKLSVHWPGHRLPQRPFPFFAWDRHGERESQRIRLHFLPLELGADLSCPLSTKMSWVDLCQSSLEHLLAVDHDGAWQRIMLVRSTISITTKSQSDKFESANYSRWLHVWRSKPAHVELGSVSSASPNKFDHRRHEPKKGSGRILNRPWNIVIKTEESKVHCDGHELVTQLDLLLVFVFEPIQSPERVGWPEWWWTTIILACSAVRRTRRSEMNSEHPSFCDQKLDMWQNCGI